MASSKSETSSSAPEAPRKDVDPEGTLSSPPASTASSTPVVLPQAQDRTELLARARTFLHSANIAPQDTTAKRQFLAEKGLQEPEIDGLLREMPQPNPPIPPRSYPQLPPSNLPNLLLGILRLFSWVTGGSAALIFIYYRFLLPKIIQTTKARASLRGHHLSLLRRLNSSIEGLKESQTKAYEVLPKPQPWKEPSEYIACRTLADIRKLSDDKSESDISEVPPVTLLRCGIADYAKGKEGDLARPNVRELFEFLETEIPWLAKEEAAEYEASIRDQSYTSLSQTVTQDKTYATLTACPFFTESEKQVDSPDEFGRWTYTAPPKAEPTPTMKALTELSTSLPSAKLTSNQEQRPFQRTLQALSDLTGYISTQVYIPYRTPKNGTYQYGHQLGPAEEEFKREIRALKGLALNRRSLLPSIPKFGNIPARPASTA